MAGIQRSRVKVGVILLTFILNNLLLETLLSIPATLGSVFWGSVSQGMLPPDNSGIIDKLVLLNWKLTFPPGHLVWKCENHSVMSYSLWHRGLYSPWNSPGQNTGGGSLSLLQGIFPTRNRTRVSCIAGGFFINRAIREVVILGSSYLGRMTQTFISTGFMPFEGLTHWKRLWCWEGLGTGGEGDDRGWDDWMASLTRWTWVWVNSGSWWWTGRPGVLRFMGLQRVGHDWATELNWTEHALRVSAFIALLWFYIDSYWLWEY